MVPAMIYLLGMPTKVVVGTSLFQIIFVTANATFWQASLNQTVDFVLAFLLLAGAVIGAQIGTVVGSAVFHVLFVIGCCAVFSKETLVLTWWPLFRDCVCYSISLLVLASFFGILTCQQIHWYEALILLLMYVGYDGIVSTGLYQRLLLTITPKHEGFPEYFKQVRARRLRLRHLRRRGR